MNRGVLQSSPLQQMTSTTGGNPNYWWNMNNNIIRPPPPPSPPQHSSSTSTTTFSAPLPPPPPPPDHYTPPVPPYFSNLWVDNIQELPPESISWSQLLLGGLVDENEKSDLSNNIMQRKKLGMMENWEQVQLLHHQQPSNRSLISDDVRQEHSTKSYMYYNYGDYDDNEEEYDGRVVAKSSWLPMPPAVSPPTSCITTLNSNKLVDLYGKKLDGRRRPPPDHSSECNSTGATAGATKKARVQPSSTQSTFKVRKEKLGDRITALHQLVSPFGKTDTASVLLEAIGYITFLHTQIQALTVPYFGNTSGKMRLQHQQQNECCEEPKKDLNNIGLCLVPVSSTLQVGNNYNGADYWAPALGSGGGDGFR